MIQQLIALLPVCIAVAAAQGTWGKPLRFRADGTFKIVEVSDTHFTNNAACTDLSAAQLQWPCSDENATAFWRTIIQAEDPDLFVFTGDNVCGGDAAGGASAIEGLLADWAEGGANSRVPWVAVEGNHDGESGLDYAEVAAKLLTMPNGLNEANPSWLGAPIYGNTNFVLTVFGPEGSPQAGTPQLSLYFIDSNSYSTNPLAGGGYGWTHQDQLAWFANQSATARSQAAAGNYTPPVGLAFQHIPLVQHREWITGGGAVVGQCHEAVSCPDVDSGELLTLMEAGDVKALTVGHDHTNDFCTAAPVNGVYLCYDGHGSYGASGYGEPDWPIRARVWLASHFGAAIATYKRLDELAGGAFPPGGNPVVDLQAIYGGSLPVGGAGTSQTTGNPACPAGMSPIDVDLNKGAGGSYSYICFARADGGNASTLLLNVTAAFGTAASPPVCPPDWVQAPGNMKEGTESAAVINLCTLAAARGDVAPGVAVVTDLLVVQDEAGPVCPAGYRAATADLSGGVGVHELLCGQWEGWTPGVAGRARGAPGATPRLPPSAAWSASRPADKGVAGAASLSHRRRSKPGQQGGKDEL